MRLLDTNNDGTPDTLYIADDPDPTKARKVWRFNYEGWGASENGYNGPFTMGATLEDGFIANFIKTGTLDAELVNIVNLIADHVVSRNGGFEMDIWAAVLKLMENNNLRVRIYSTGQGAGGLVQVFSGTVTDAGGLGEDGAYSYLGPTGAGVGEKSDGSYVGTFRTGTLVVYNAVKADSGDAILSVQNGQRVGHFDRLAIGETADFSVSWVWDAQLSRYVLCSNNS